MEAERLRRTEQMFGKKKSETASIATLIGADTVVTGDLDFSGGLHLNGRVVGDIRSGSSGSATLTIGPGGVIEGSVHVDELVLNGTVRGDVTASQRVELGPGAQVDGNVTYGVLEMAAGARVNGRLIHQPGGEQAPPAPAAEGAPETQSAPEGDEVPGVR
jgi:cytoskeletal protein CcmA (bactofilin family)